CTTFCTGSYCSSTPW
nr:immunoglobulin heavy chain junction region [Macaca mulatta]MOV54662.1 immunoglobulin heavy chain junction region [Macaca mulatta]MOV55953.1 immunoglobulin heavy chain junction region [Macaca mulatta]MOV57405.1 immunoglobulin heavy chain junction region [Macaca mulatta]MOV59321.1 immunoglobulin heavy chain junction region [Macaca mulatta]